MPKKKPDKEPAMKFWSIAFHVDATGWIAVRATTKEAAEELANDEFLPTVENTELGDTQEIVDCNEITEAEYAKYKD